MSTVVELLIRKTKEGKLHWIRSEGRYETRLRANNGYIHVGLTYVNFDGYPIENINGLKELNTCINDSIELSIINSKLRNENSLIEQLNKL